MTAKNKKPKATKAKSQKPKAKKITAANAREAQKDNKLIQRHGIGLWDPAAIVATVFSVGRIPWAPGTWGSLTGVVYFPVFLIASLYVSQHTSQALVVAAFSVALLVLLYCIGVSAIKTYQTRTKTSDAPEVVYDEFFGQIFTYSAAYTAFFMIVGGQGVVAVDQKHALVYEFIPFLFFRLFDICKPWPINIVDRIENSAWGVMFDDVLAACYAAAASVVVFLVLDGYI